VTITRTVRKDSSVLTLAQGTKDLGSDYEYFPLLFSLGIPNVKIYKLIVRKSLFLSKIENCNSTLFMFSVNVLLYVRSIWEDSLQRSVSPECLNQKRQLAVVFPRSTERVWEASESELSVERKASWSPPRKKRKKKCQCNQDDKKAVHILFCLISPVPYTLATSSNTSSS